MSAEQPSKRRRASELGLLGHSPLLQAWQSNDEGAPEPAGQGEPRPDVFEFLSQRSQKQRDLEGTVQHLQQREAELAKKLQEAQRQLSSVKVSSLFICARQGGSLCYYSSL